VLGSIAQRINVIIIGVRRRMKKRTQRKKKSAGYKERGIGLGGKRTKRKRVGIEGKKMEEGFKDWRREGLKNIETRTGGVALEKELL